MCGIAGEFRFDGRLVDAAHVVKMTDAIAHRGPDAEGLYCSGTIGLGHRRLSIIDLSEAGRQPIWNAAGSLAVVYNGEIYNYREIRAQLQSEGRVFRTETDTEVLVEAVDAWGIEKALKQFIGMFAFVLWDEREHRVTLCRDRIGIKPLYYSLNSSRLLFASELKGLLANPDFIRKVNLRGIGQAMVTGYAIGTETPFADALRLPAGHYLTVRASGASELHRYWSLDEIERGSYQGNFDEAVEELLSICESAFGYRLVADVPVGLFQSGGVDSSLVAAVLKKRIGADVQSITIGFSDKEYDEAPRARAIAESLGVRHLSHYVSPLEAQDILAKFVEIFDEPFGDTSGIPTFILSRLARQNVKVALSADGGDEQFCGYESYGSYAGRAALVEGIPFTARHLLASVLRRLPLYRPLLYFKSIRESGNSYAPQVTARYEKMIRVLGSTSAADVLQRMHEFAFQPEEIAAALPGSQGDPISGTKLAASNFMRRDNGLLDAMMRTDFTTYLRDDILVKVDRASMAASLECRDPMLDHRIAEFAFRLPVDFLYSGGEHKKLLRTLAQRWIDREVLDKPKRGFVIPLYYWLRGAWKPVALDTLAPHRVIRTGLFDPKFVADELKRFYGQEGGRAERIWMLLNVQMWAERWMFSN